MRPQDKLNLSQSREMQESPRRKLEQRLGQHTDKETKRLTLGDVEIAFIRILSLQARRAGIQLDWNIYNR